MQEYVQKMHDAFINKARQKLTRKVASVRLRNNDDVTNSLICTASKLDNMGYILVLNAKGKTTLPNYVILRGFELLALRSKILNEAGRALVTLDIFEGRS